jgi:hypothetical protein
MFMRYVGGGIGHLNQQPKIADSDAMEVDATHEDYGNMPAGDDLQIQQLEQLAQDLIYNHAEQQVGPGDVDQATDDESTRSDNEDSSGSCSMWDSDLDVDSIKDDDSEMGPEDGEGFSDNDSKDGYGSP